MTTGGQTRQPDPVKPKTGGRFKELQSPAARNVGDRQMGALGVAIAPEWYYHAQVKTLTVKLPDPLFAEISRMAEARKVPKSEIVRERLVNAGASAISLWNRMEDLVIREDKMPCDLSSNKAHLDGYGKNRDHR